MHLSNRVNKLGKKRNSCSVENERRRERLNFFQKKKSFVSLVLTVGPFCLDISSTTLVIHAKRYLLCIVENPTVNYELASSIIHGFRL